MYYWLSMAFKCPLKWCNIGVTKTLNVRHIYKREEARCYSGIPKEKKWGLWLIGVIPFSNEQKLQTETFKSMVK